MFGIRSSEESEVLLAIESFLFVWVHLQYRETGTLVMVIVLGLVMAFIAYGRAVLKPIL